MHINEGKGKLDLFNTKDNVLLTPHPSYSSAIDLFPFLILLFSFNFYPRTHRPYIDPTSTLHGPHNDPTLNFFFPPSHFYCFPPPQPPPRFYCFPLPPPPPPHTTFLLFFVEDRVSVGSMQGRCLIFKHQKLPLSSELKCYIELRMNNHCGESVGFSFRATLWFRRPLILLTRSFLGSLS